MSVAVHLAAVVAGIVIVLATLYSAVKTVVVPRAESSVITRSLFFGMRRLFDVLAPPGMAFAKRDHRLALYAPLSLVLLPGLWVGLVITGFTLIYWGTYEDSLWRAFEESGSSLLTLGFVRPDAPGHTVLAFVEATLGLGLVALLISYLPSMYSSFARREQLVGMLEVRAGIPPSAAELISRYHRIGLLPDIHVELFPAWEAWFMDVEESHTSHPSLVHFRSPEPNRSWITAAGCVLDTAALVDSTVDVERHGNTAVMLRTGFFALRRIADYFGMDHDPDPRPDDPIMVTREEYDRVVVELEAAGVPLRGDREQTWRDFAGWRVNYDRVLVQLAAFVVAPPGHWSSDRAVPRHRPGMVASSRRVRIPRRRSRPRPTPR